MTIDFSTFRQKTSQLFEEYMHIEKERLFHSRKNEQDQQWCEQVRVLRQNFSAIVQADPSLRRNVEWHFVASQIATLGKVLDEERLKEMTQEGPSSHAFSLASLVCTVCSIVFVVFLWAHPKDNARFG